MDRLNTLYASYSSADFQYQENPSEANKTLLYVVTNDLLGDVRDYAIRVVCQVGINRNWTLDSLKDDIAQESTLSVWQALPTFRGESEFSSWCYRIVYNETKDFVKQTGRRRELPYYEWKVYHTDYAGTKCGPEGTPPLGETDESSEGRRYADSCIADSLSNADDGHGRQELFPRSEWARAEKAIIGSIDLEIGKDALTSLDESVFTAFYQLNWSAAEIAVELGQNVRFVENKLAKIRKKFHSM